MGGHVHWKEQSNDATATAGDTGEYVWGPCIQRVFTHCLAYTQLSRHVNDMSLHTKDCITSKRHMTLHVPLTALRHNNGCSEGPVGTKACLTSENSLLPQ